MKLRLLPRQEDAYFGLFEAAADTIVAAANTLLRMLGDLAEAEALAKQLADLEHEGDRITRDILTRLATTFIAPLDRDEISTWPTDWMTSMTPSRRSATWPCCTASANPSTACWSRLGFWSGQPSTPPRGFAGCDSQAPNPWPST
jgi:hypothetical protein